MAKLSKPNTRISYSGAYPKNHGGYNWENGCIAFGDPLEAKTNKAKAREYQKKTYVRRSKPIELKYTNQVF